MDPRRHDFQELLETMCSNVYFQPPANVQMIYPAIVYERAGTSVQFADDKPYRSTKQYSLSLISRDPDDNIFEVLAALPMCSHQRFFVMDNLNHDVFSIHF